MTNTLCPECGALNAGCRARFDEFLMLEFTQAKYGAVHHLTVAAYMLQHSSNLTKDGWLCERGLLGEFLVANKPPEIARKQNKDKLDSGRRAFKIKSKTGLPIIPKITWLKTILDVHVNNAETYCADVTAWAKAVLADAEAIEIQ